MTHIITAKNTTVTEGIRGYIENKFAKFSKYIPDDSQVNTKIEVKENGRRHKVEITIFLGKKTVRAESCAENMYAAIDDAERKMSDILRKYKERIVDKNQQGRKPEIIDEVYTEHNHNLFSRVKTHEIGYMTDEEAVEAMELVGHTFFAYVNDISGKLCVVYKRNGNTYGKIEYNVKP